MQPIAAGSPGEKRRANRLRWDLHVTVQRQDGRGTRLMSYDWTDTSVLLRTNEPFATGAPVELIAVVGRPARQVTLAGSVTRVVRFDPARPQAPQGIVITFKELPQVLRQALTDASRSKSGAISEATVTMTAAPAALVITTDQGFSTDAGRVLNRAGFDVTVSTDDVQAKRLLDAQLRPKLWLMAGKSVAALYPLMSRYYLMNPPELVVIIGEPPGELGRGKKPPIVMLPTGWPLDKLPQVIGAFLSSGAEVGQRAPIIR